MAFRWFPTGMPPGRESFTREQVDPLAHLHMENHIRVMDIHPHLGNAFQDRLSHVPVDLLRGHRILLVPLLAFTLKVMFLSG